MHSFYFLAALVALSSAAPHLQDRHQNRPHHRRALLHEDLLALYQDTATSTEVDAAASATPTTACVGPYCGSVHGGNTNEAKALVAATVTATGIMATQTASMDGSDLPDGWTIASAPRNTTQFSNSWYNATDAADIEPESLVSSSAGDDSLEAVAVQKHTGVPSWAIALVSALAVLLLGGLVAFFVLRRRAIRSGEKSGSETSKTTTAAADADDALSSYKAFWELKRQSAGSFVSADATPAAIASDLVAASVTGQQPPVYVERPVLVGATSAASTPVTERAPPRGFLYQ